MAPRASRTRRVLTTLAVVFLGVYLVLLQVIGRPLRAFLLEIAGLLGVWVAYVSRFASVDPRALAPEVMWFRIKDWLRPPQAGVIVFVGSSTIAHWSTLVNDMAPVPVLNRGINGARLTQVSHYADRLILSHAPRGVVVYGGENDLAGFLGSKKMTPEEVLAAFRELCHKVQARFPAARISFISIKPAPTRAGSAASFRRANELVRAYCAGDGFTRFIDVVPAMVETTGSPRAEIFERDGLHLNDEGYRILTDAVKPYLLSDVADPGPHRA